MKNPLLRGAVVLGSISLLLVACKQSSTPPAAPSVHLEEQEARLDATVWREEVLAKSYEKTFVRLADALRKVPDKATVLAHFEFERILIPQTSVADHIYALDIHHQRFEGTNRLVLTHAQWQQAIAQFQQTGWRVLQTEWRHEKFRAGTNGAATWSEFNFEIHGDQVEQTNRFILQGTLEIEWVSDRLAPERKKPESITVTKLELLERRGLPAFDNHLLVAPEPSRPDGTVSLHPLIVQDINNDRHDDILLPGVNTVLLNDGHAQFQNQPLIAPEHYFPLTGAGVVADFDGDGQLDYLGVADSGPFEKLLVLYRGDGTVPLKASPVAVWEEQRAHWARYRFDSASVITAGDIDGDGDLDVFVGQYRPPYIGGNLPTPYYDANDGYPSYLLLNDGHGRFTQAPLQSSLLAKSHRRTLSASLADLDLDGDLDLVMVNDFCGVDLFYNDGKGHFSDETARLGDRRLFGMAHCIADFDRDGRPDLLAIGMSLPTVDRLEFMKVGRSDLPERTRARTDMAHGNRLYLARDGGQWSTPPFASQLARTGWSWGTTAFDLDNDGKLDVYIANGHVSGASAEDYDSHYWTHDIYLDGAKDQAALQQYLTKALAGLNSGQTSWNGYQHNALFLDVGTNDYLNVAYLMGVAHEADCRAVVSADMNEDGKSDLLVIETKWGGSPHQFRNQLLVHLNQLQTSNHWIGVRLSSRTNAVPALGAKAFIMTNARTYVRAIVTGDSFQSQHPCTLHFGLGRTERVKELKIVWPDGKTNSIAEPKVDMYYSIAR